MSKSILLAVFVLFMVAGLQFAGSVDTSDSKIERCHKWENCQF